MPEFPKSVAHVWEWYVALKNSGEVCATQIQAYFDLRGIEPLPCEVDALLMLDVISRTSD